jgi:hypothetical protein
MVGILVYMYENGKIIVETVPVTGEGVIKENGGGMNLIKIYCKNFCKCHNVPQVQQYDNKNTTIKAMI